MYSFDDFMNMDTLQEKALEAIRADIAKLTARRAEAMTALKMAATRGDAKAYNKADDEARALDAQIAEKTAEMAHPVPYTPEDVLAAWADYAEGHNAAMAEKMGEYEAARHEAAQTYRAMIDLQNEALFTRLRFAALAGLPTQFTDFNGMAPVTLLNKGQRAKGETGGRYVPIDMLYFILTGEYPRGNYPGMVQVIDSQTPADILSYMPTGAEANALTLAKLTI